MLELALGFGWVVDLGGAMAYDPAPSPASLSGGALHICGVVGGGREGCCRRAVAGSPGLGSVFRGHGMMYDVLIYFERVRVMEEDDLSVEFVCPSPHDAFDVVIRRECDMWGELMCVRGEEELVVCAAEDVACV